MLHEDFYISLMDLPEQYDFGMYSRFFNAYGTHYVTQGTMGGTLEYVLVVNKTNLAKSSTPGGLALTPSSAAECIWVFDVFPFRRAGGAGGSMLRRHHRSELPHKRRHESGP